MRNMKQAIVALAAAALLAGPVVAQQGQGPARGQQDRAWAGPGSMARNPVAVLLERREALGLTGDQVARLEAIQARVERENAPRIQQLQAVLGDRSPRDLTDEERAQLRARMRELDPVRDQIRQTNRAAMQEAREILTAEQQAGLRDTMARRPGGGARGARGARGPRDGGRAFEGRGAPVAGGVAARVLEQRESLGLTAEQVARLEAVRDRVAGENEARLEQLRADRSDRAALIGAIRESHRASLESVREILTDEQEAMLRELAPRRRGAAGS